MKKIILLLGLFLVSLNSYSQLENIPLITVEGEGVIQVKPDYVILGFQVFKELKIKPDGTPVGFEIFNEQDTKVRLFSFEQSDISETTIQYVKGKYFKEIFVIIKNIGELDRVLVELSKLGFRECIYKEYRVTNFAEYKNEAREKALIAAKEKASLMANSFGQSIGKAHTITELELNDNNWFDKSTMYIQNDNIVESINTSENKLLYYNDFDDYLIEPGYISISAKVQVSFDLIK